ncbi:MAG: DUF2586 family protein [Paludibacteraceae bacterium]|nr:DUF2586 family protein [Paludibacteraceae bacterium]
MLPRVKIDFRNGALGSITPSADCVAGLIATATAVSTTFVLGHAYILYKLDDLASLGVTAENNACLYNAVQQFYDEAGDGAELWIMGAPNTVKPSEILDKDNATFTYAKNLIQLANGRIRMMTVAYAPASGYEPTITDGLDSDVWTAALKAQALAEWATNSLFAPLFVVIAGRSYSNDNITNLKDLTTLEYNRVGILIGDVTSGSDGAAVGLLLGKIAACPVQRHIGRVKDGALKILNAYIDDKDPSVANVETIFNKGYITFRTFTGKSGYFFADDCLATEVIDDFRSIARRRTIDKAYRIVYATMLEHINDELPITESGTPVAAMVKSWEADVQTNVVNQMTSQGELGNDPNDPNDLGVKVFIDHTQNIVSTNRLEMTVQVKPFGYSKYIDVELGFITISTED